MPQTEPWWNPEAIPQRREIEGASQAGRAPWLETVAAPFSGSAPWDSRQGTVAVEPLAGLIHDARNLVSALDLYCDLLEEPGVLTPAYRHYAPELRRVGAANRRLLQSLAHLEQGAGGVEPEESPLRLAPRLRSRRQPERVRELRAAAEMPTIAPVRSPHSRETSAMRPFLHSNPQSLTRASRRRVFLEGAKVENLAEELQANRNLLTALAGHAVTLGMSIQGCRRPIAMTADDLTRILVNLTKNAAEAMPGGGHLQIDLEEAEGRMTLTFTDNGPGIPEDALESIFSPGFSTHVGLREEADPSAWPAQHRGLGLSIVRSLVSAAGGAVWAANCVREPLGVPANASAAPEDSSGRSSRSAVFLLEFPIVERSLEGKQTGHSS